MIIENLSGEDTRELHVENATVVDCGGVLIKPVFIVIKKISVFIEGNYSKCNSYRDRGIDCIIWLCPNYNDVISAKLMAIINRITVLYRGG